MSTLIDSANYDNRKVEFYKTSKGKFMGVIYPNETSNYAIDCTNEVDSFTDCVNQSYDKVVKLNTVNSKKVIDFTYCGMRTDVYHNRLTGDFFGMIFNTELGVVAQSSTPAYNSVNDCAKYAFELMKQAFDFRLKFA